MVRNGGWGEGYEQGNWKQAGLWARFLDRMIELGILGGWMGVRLWRTWVLAKFLGADNQAYMGVFGENLDINKAQEPGHAI